MADENPVKRKQHEPILVVFGVILLAACLLAVGIHVNDNMLNKTETTVDNSSTVEVNYTGSLYGYYDDGGAMFQTTLKNVDENTSNVRIASYSYSSSTLSVDMSNYTVLKGFADALLGHKVGDTVKVTIPASEAYKAPETYGVQAMTGVSTTNNFYVSSVDELKDIDALGWTYKTVFDSARDQYLVYFDQTVMAADDYKCTVTLDSDTNKFATVTTSNFQFSADGKTMTYDVSVTAKAVSNTITYEDVKYTEVQGFHLVIDGSTVLITGAQTISDDGTVSGNLLTKATSQITNETLYFVINIVSIE